MTDQATVVKEVAPPPAWKPDIQVKIIIGLSALFAILELVFVVAALCTMHRDPACVPWVILVSLFLAPLALLTLFSACCLLLRRKHLLIRLMMTPQWCLVAFVCLPFRESLSVNLIMTGVELLPCYAFWVLLWHCRK
jgi:hypothetical protein